MTKYMQNLVCHFDICSNTYCINYLTPNIVRTISNTDNNVQLELTITMFNGLTLMRSQR